jgi:hydrogenase maturation protease
MTPGRPACLVIGLGNAYRQDDGAGLAVAARLRAAARPGVAVMELPGEPIGLLDAWAGAELVYLVDAVSAGGRAGTVYRIDLHPGAGLAPGPFGHRGTHAFSLADVVGLGRALGGLPPRLIAYGIEGAAFAAGTGLSRPARRAVSRVVTRLRRELPRSDAIT